YQVECFVPAPKRKYGYFSLPILIGDTFVARMDSKADRKNKVLIVHNLHFEEAELSETMLEKLAGTLKEFIVFNQCRDVTFAKCNRPEYLDAIRNAF
ncbi:MAG: crosslink repair DNA glycosylase YcaQ family protein, partial [Bacteroidota bacterium]